MIMSNGYTRHSSTGSSSTTSGLPSQQDESERLSSDLALFLSDPNLQSALADGSLDLSSYSSTINLDRIEIGLGLMIDVHSHLVGRGGQR